MSAIPAQQVDALERRETRAEALIRQLQGKLPPLVELFPSNPKDGQLVYIQTAPMLTAGYGPILAMYRAGAGGTYKWFAIGGGEMYAQQTASVAHTTASVTTYTALGNMPTMVAPVTGLYTFEAGGSIMNSSSVGAGVMGEGRVTLNVGGTNVYLAGSQSDKDGLVGGQYHGRTHTAISAGQVLSLVASTNNLSINFGNPALWRMNARPLRMLG